jgi:protein SCO1/2
MNRFGKVALYLVPTLCLAALFVTRGVAGSDQQNEKPSRLAVIRDAPEFTLTTQAGDKLTSTDLKGKVLLVSFIFTTCNGTCPATTHRMSQIQDELKSRGLLKADRVRLLSISLDPARDTPEVLRGYMKLYDAEPEYWTFLTGPPDQVSDVVKAWGMWAKPAANGQFDHPSRIFLVDSEGRVREIYNLSFLKPKWVAQDVELLLKESK